jgi:hypothetical protein
VSAIVSFARDFSVNFLANLGGALIGVLLAFRLDRRRGRNENQRLYGRILNSCRFELNYFRSSLVSARQWVESGKGTGDLWGLPASRGAVINPLVHEHAPRPLITVLNAVVVYAEVNVRGIEKFASIQPMVARANPSTEGGKQILDAFPNAQRSLTNSLTVEHGMVELAVETLDKEIQRLGLAVEADPADHAMGEKIVQIIKESFGDLHPPTNPPG